MIAPSSSSSVHALRAAFHAADQTGQSVFVPAGTYELDYPLRVPRPYGVVRGEGPRTSILRAKPGTFTPLLVALPPGADVSPVGPDGLVYPGRGWFSFSDFSQDFGNSAAFTFDVTLTLPNPIPDGEWILGAGYGSLDDVTADVPFMLSVFPDGRLMYALTTTGGYARFESPPNAITPGLRSRVVCQYGNGHVRVWVVDEMDGSNLVIAVEWSGATVFPAHTNVVVGSVPHRFPEGAGWHRPPTGTVYRAAQVEAYALYTPADPPTNPVTRDDNLGVFTRFEHPDGAFFRGTVASLPAVFFWRAGVGDVPGGNAWVGDLGLFQGTIDLLLSNQHNWSVRDVHAGEGGRYGILLQNQCYGGVLDTVHVAGSTHVGIALCNNSSLVALRDPSLGTCKFGAIASDSDVLTIGGGRFENCNTALVVKGDNCSVAATGTAFGSEAANVRRGVLLCNTSSAVFDGCTFTPLTDPVPAVEFRGSSGGVFAGPRFGMHPGAGCAIHVTGHDPIRPVRVVGEGRRWAGAADTVPLSNDPSVVIS